jgi:type I restriction enzyme M protein
MARATQTKDVNNKTFNSPQSLNSAIKSICNIMRRSNCAGALQYVPELTWILFLRILDETETREAETAEAVGADYIPSLEAPYRWQDWAAPPDLRLPIADFRLKDKSSPKPGTDNPEFYPG